jgi:hypothetical protein
MISSFQVFSGTSLAVLQGSEHMMMSASSGEYTLFVMAQNVCRSLRLPGNEGKDLSNNSVHVASDNSQPAPKQER